jgi:soluble lytic murein transglycosylase
LARTTPASWPSAIAFGGLVALAVAGAAAGGAAATPAAKPAPKKPAPKKAMPAPAGELAALTQSYRLAPTPAHRAALQRYAAAHAKDRNGSLAPLALGVTAYDNKDYPTALAALKAAAVPQLADYIGYYSAAAQVGLNSAPNGASVAREAAAAHAAAVPSPLSGKAWLLEARSMIGAPSAANAPKPAVSAGAAAVRLLRERYAELPQPEGDLALADCYWAAGDLANAADYYQRVYYRTVSGEAADRAASALSTLKGIMGAAYPEPLPRQLLQRADAILAAGDYRRARAEYQSVAARTAGLEHDFAEVGSAAAQFQEGATAPACSAVRNLSFADSEAEAERDYYLEECARRQDDDEATTSALKRLAGRFPQSPWRFKALMAAANRYLVANRPDDYLPLYREAYEAFPDEPSASTCHWKVVFHAWMAGDAGAADLLREHLRKFPESPTAGAALYFLGRAAERASGFAAARADYRRLVQAFQNTYYAAQARLRLGRSEVASAPRSDEADAFLNSLKLPQADPVPSDATSATAARIERSRLLRTAGLADLADSELRFGARNAEQPELLAMELAGAAAAPHEAMHVMKAMAPEYLNLPISAASRRFWDLLFPLPFRTELFQDARAQGLDPYLVAGLIRQESEFDPQAVSHAAAMGLTQIRYVTGRQFAHKAGVSPFSRRMLFQPAANLKIGSAILRALLDRNGGQIEATLAAYNAGPEVAAKWLSWNRYREPAEFVESVPYTETRDYIQAVMRNADMYRRLYGQ